MAKSIDQQIKDAMAKKVVGRTTEIYKAVVLELYRRSTANSLQVGLAYGSPVLTGRYYASHTMGLFQQRSVNSHRTLPRPRFVPAIGATIRGFWIPRFFSQL